MQHKHPETILPEQGKAGNFAIFAMIQGEQTTSFTLHQKNAHFLLFPENAPSLCKK